jgi:hypothetical protein
LARRPELAPQARERAARDLPAWLWAGFPPLMLLGLIAGSLFAPEWIGAITRADHDPLGTGIAEHATVIVLLPGIAAGFAAFRMRRLLPDWRLGWWILAWTLACVYFAGEEVSWGQHLFGWQTPESLQAVNRQQETNIHNISSWFDRKPRAVVELWIIVGGLAVPLWQLLRRARPSPEGLSYWIWPTIVAAPSAALFTLFRLHRWVAEATGREVVVAWLSESEVREYYVALFLGIYLLSFWVRLRALRPPA